MPSVFYPLESSLDIATARQTLLANCEVHLFTDALVVTGSVTLAQLQGAECTYDGYAAKTIAAWFAPILASVAGYEINAPTQQFDSVPAAPPVLENVQGAWIETAAGDLHLCIVFDDVIPMGAAGQGFPLPLREVFPTGYTG